MYLFYFSGGTVRLPRLIGPSKAKELIFTGRVLNSVEALEIGMIDYSVKQNADGDAAYQKSLQLASEMLARGPVALKMAKKSISKGIEVRIGYFDHNCKVIRIHIISNFLQRYSLNETSSN